MELSMLPVPKIPNNQPTVPAPQRTHHPKPNLAPAAPTPINWLWVVRDVVIVFLITYMGTKAAGFTAAALHNNAFMERLPTINIFFLTLAFFILPYLVPTNRARHFAIVATTLWIVGVLPNIIFLNAPLPMLLIHALASATIIAFAVMVGGSAGCALFKIKKRN